MTNAAMAPMPPMAPMAPMKIGLARGSNTRIAKSSGRIASASGEIASSSGRRRERDRESSLYEQGNNAIYEGRWDRAVSSFTRLADLKGPSADAALYWKAYAQNRLGQRAEALATIGELTKDYPKSRYLKQAKALEAEVRRNSRPARAARGRERRGAEAHRHQRARRTAIPSRRCRCSRSSSHGTASPRLKGRALFVLAQSNSPRAREVLKNIAKGSSTPELQNHAIQYLGVHGGRESRAALAEIYASTTDVDVKRRILRAFMVAGEKDRAVDRGADRTEPRAARRGRPAARRDGRQRRAVADLSEGNVGRRQAAIMSAMFVGGNAARMIELAKTEKNPELRRLAVRNLGVMGGRTAGDALVEIYATDKDPAIRRQVINGAVHPGQRRRARGPRAQGSRTWR